MPYVSRSAVKIQVSTDIVHVKRWDGGIHIVARGPPPVFYVNMGGQPQGEPFIATMICGARAKMNEGSRSRFTDQPATCITCIAEESNEP